MNGPVQGVARHHRSPHLIITQDYIRSVPSIDAPCLAPAGLSLPRSSARSGVQGGVSVMPSLDPDQVRERRASCAPDHPTLSEKHDSAVKSPIAMCSFTFSARRLPVAIPVTHPKDGSGHRP